MKTKSELHLVRKLWHLFMGVFMAGLYAQGLPRTTSVILLTLAFGLCMLIEVFRLRSEHVNRMAMKWLGPIMRSDEIDQVSGTPYYIAAVALTVGIFPKNIAILAILYLALGDPISSIVGIQWGDLSYRFKNGKSLIGTSAGILVCAVVTWVVLSHSPLAAFQLAILTLVGGLAGGAAEVLPLDVDDNFSIPLVSGFTLWLAFIFLGA